MRLFIITKGERESQLTYNTFRHMEPVFVTHDEHRADFLRGVADGAEVLVSGIPTGPRGKIEQQRWLFQNHVKHGEWVMVADDNIEKLIGIPPKDRSYWSKTERTKEKNRVLRSDIDVADWSENEIPILIEAARRSGAKMIGGASNANPLSRHRRWGTCSFVWGKMTIWQCDHDYQWDETVSAMEDWGHTASHLFQYGAVLVDYYTYPVAKRYMPGGLGSLGERSRGRDIDVEHLMKLYPGLFRERMKPSGERDLVLARNRKTIRGWRREFIRQLAEGSI